MVRPIGLHSIQNLRGLRLKHRESSKESEMVAGRAITGIDLSTGQPFSANAFGDDSHDDWNTIQTAINTCGLINVPSGIYRLSRGLTFPSSGGIATTYGPCIL